MVYLHGRPNTVAIKSPVLAKSEEIDEKSNFYFFYSIRLCEVLSSGNLRWRQTYVRSAFLLTVGCKRDEPLFVTSGLREQTIRPGSLGDAKLNSNKHFWHFWPWVQENRAAALLVQLRIEQGSFLRNPVAQPGDPSNLLQAWPLYFWDQTHFTPRPKHLALTLHYAHLCFSWRLSQFLYA